MEFNYVDFLCHNLLNKNMSLSILYKTYEMNHPEDEHFEFYFDEELVKLIVKMLQNGSEYNFTTIECLDALFKYIKGIRMLCDTKYALYKSEEYLNNLAAIKEKEEIKGLSCYSFADSVLLRYEFDSYKSKGKFFFHNVTLYDNLEETVSSVSIVITFLGIKDLKLRGKFDFEFLRAGNCYADKIVKISEELYSFSLLCIANYEHFIIEFTFSDFLVEDFENGADKYGRILEGY